MPRYCPLPSYGCIEVRGADTATFLNGQLSRSVDALDGSLAPLAGWHDPRGRVRALLRVARRKDRWWLVTHSDVVAATAKRLAMFVLRAEVTIAPADDVRVAALLDADDAWLVARGVDPATATNGAAQSDELVYVRLGPNVWHVIGPRAAVEPLGAALPSAPTEDALLAEIRLGLPTVSAPVVEHFVAQMLNLDVLDAVSFDKGCYPGQEVIARVRHRGAVKRRLRLYASGAATPPAPGSPVVASADGTSVGEVVRAARAAAGVELLAVIEDAAATAGLAIDGVPLRELPLPYRVPTT